MSELLHNPVVKAVLALIVIYLFNRVARIVIDRVIRNSIRAGRHTKNKDELAMRATTVSKVCQTAASVVIWIVGILVIVGFYVDVASLATGAGLASVIIGLSAQTTLKDFLAGIFIIVENQYDVGDVIGIKTTAGLTVWGQVEDLSIRITRLRDLEGNLHIVANGSAQIISNGTAHYSVVNIRLHVKYDTDTERLARIANRVGTELAADKAYVKDIIEPIEFLRIDAFDDYAAVALMVGKVKPSTQYVIGGEFRARLMNELKKEGIEVPIANLLARPAK